MLSLNLFDFLKTGFISLILSIIFLVGCSEDDCPPCSTPTDDRISFEMNFLEYSDNNYFINEIYADTSSELNMFNLYYGNIPAIVLPKYYVKEIEVYKSVNVLSGSSIFGCAYIDLESRYEYSTYNDSLRDFSSAIPGKKEINRFYLLNEVRDYIFHRETGYITFTSALNEQDIIAIAYRTENNNSYAVLKLVKPRNLQPAYSTAWKLKMRNIYQIVPYIGQVTNLDLDIYLKKSDGSETNSINNVRLLELFGFDKIKEGGSLGSDGKFDNRIGYNYEPRTSEIIFSVIEPFGNNIPPLLNEYKYDSIYDTVKYKPM